MLARQYGAYLFDLDGTLVDTAPDINAALNAALSSGGFPEVTEALTRHWVGHGSRVLLQQALTHHGAPDLIADETLMARLLKAFIDYYSGHIADFSRPYPGVEEALLALRSRGARLAVVTNKLTGLSNQVLAELQLDAHFTAVVCGDTLPQHKPDPAPALHACRLPRCHTDRRVVRRRFSDRCRHRTRGRLLRGLRARRLQPRHARDSTRRGRRD